VLPVVTPATVWAAAVSPADFSLHLQDAITSPTAPQDRRAKHDLYMRFRFHFTGLGRVFASIYVIPALGSGVPVGFGVCESAEEM
jgi:hypothetical protein